MTVIGFKEANVAFDTMNMLENEETNWKDRWPLQESWQKLKTLADDCYEGCGRPSSPPVDPADSNCSTLGNGCFGAVIGINGASVVFGPIERLEREETSWKDRQPLQESWLGLKTHKGGAPKAEGCCEGCGRVR